MFHVNVTARYLKYVSKYVRTTSCELGMVWKTAESVKCTTEFIANSVTLVVLMFLVTDRQTDRHIYGWIGR